MLSNAPRDLFDAAYNVALNAYAPYSGFGVGAALRTIDGSIHIGANMENASFGMTMCAEVGAIQAASSCGKLAHIVQIAIVGAPLAGFGRAPGSLVTPCGRCRQLILEAAHLGARDVEVWCADATLTDVGYFRISQLLPNSFGPASLRAENGQFRKD